MRKNKGFGMFLAIPKVGNLVDITDKESNVDTYSKQMFIKTNVMFKYNGLKDFQNIRPSVFAFMLQYYGFVLLTRVYDSEITVNKDKYKEGLYCFGEGVSLGGVQDYLYRPTKAIISNPSMGLSIEREIDVDCVLVRNDMLLYGFRDINNKYASMLAENDVTFRVYDINKRIMSVLTASDSDVRDSAKEYYKDIEKGKLGVVVADAQFLEDLRSQPYNSSSGELISLIEYHQYIKANWENSLGLESNYNMKRENLGSEETSVNQSTIVPSIDSMLKCQTEDFEKANEMFGCSLSVEKSSSWENIEKDIENDLNDKKENETTNEVTENDTEQASNN